MKMLRSSGYVSPQGPSITYLIPEQKIPKDLTKTLESGVFVAHEVIEVPDNAAPQKVVEAMQKDLMEHEGIERCQAFVYHGVTQVLPQLNPNAMAMLEVNGCLEKKHLLQVLDQVWRHGAYKGQTICVMKGDDVLEMTYGAVLESKREKKEPWQQHEPWEREPWQGDPSDDE